MQEEEQEEGRISIHNSRLHEFPYIAAASLASFKAKYGNHIKPMLICCVLIGIIIVLAVSLLIWQLSGSKTAKGMLIVGGYHAVVADQASSFSSFEWYQNPDDTASTPLPQMLQPRSYHVSWHSKHKIFYAGGKNETGHVLASTEVLDLHTFTVSEGPSLITNRLYAAGATFGKTYLICGGAQTFRSRSASLSSCEQLVKNKWQRFTSMPKTLQGLQMINMDGKILVLGGLHNWVMPAKSVYEYDSEQEMWIPKSDMLVPRAHFGAAVLNGDVFVCGGFERFVKFEKGCEKYLASQNKWVMVASMLKRRDLFAMIPLDDHLLVLGGYDREFNDKKGAIEHIVYDSAEEYYPSNDSWVLAPIMKTPVSGHTVVVLL